MTRNRISTIILVKARDLQDFDYYICQMLVDANLKRLFPSSIMVLLFILKKTGILHSQLLSTVPATVWYFFILCIPISLYYVSVNKKGTFQHPNLDLYTDDELLILTRGLNRKRKLMKGFVNSAAPWKAAWFEVLIIVVGCIGIVYQYGEPNFQSATELIVSLTILITFGLVSMFTLRRDAKRFDMLQKAIHMKAKNAIFDYLILSKLNPYNHATTRSDK